MTAKRGPKPKPAGGFRSPTVKGKAARATPSYLKGFAREAYVFAVSRLKDAGTLDVANPMLIELFAINYELVRTAKAELDRDGPIFSTERGLQPHPAIGTVNAASIRMRGFIADLEALRAPTGSRGTAEGEDGWDALLSITG